RRPRRAGTPSRRIRSGGLGEPREGLAARQPLRRAAAGPGGRVDLIDAERAVAAQVGDATTVAPVGTGTHREVGGPPPAGTEVRAPAGIVTYDPAELTVTVGAGTTVADL